MLDVRIEQLFWRWKELRDQGTPASSQEMCRDCPELLPELQKRLDAEVAVATEAERPLHRNAVVLDAATRTENEFCETLRRRLRLVTFIYLIQWALFSSLTIFQGERFSPVAVLEIVIMAVAALALSRKRTWRRPGLRILEVVIFGSVLLRITLGQGAFLASGQLVEMARAGDADKLYFLADRLIMPWFTLVVVYGVFVPNTWRRCALIAGSLLLVPLGLTIGFAGFQGILASPLVEGPLMQMGLRMAWAFAIAVYGSYRIDQLQREAATARQLGQYTLKRCLGRGGMGEVYLAEHQMLRRPCAVKLIRGDKSASLSHHQRFEREVQTLANLSHGNIVEVFDFGVAPDGTFYYVMEYLQGLTLHELVERFGPLTPARAVHFLRQIVSALRAAHSRGIIHRDIKPANVIVCEKSGVQDVVKLLDFGLVQIRTGADDAHLTQDGGLVGTPAFMSPEQIAGARILDARSDIYSVGVLAYYLLTGQNPFDRPEVRQIFAAHLHDPAPPLCKAVAGIEADLEGVVRRCLAKEPADRFVDAAALEEALAACSSAGAWGAAQADTWWRERERS